MAWKTIEKPRQWAQTPNLPDYERTRADFSWTQARAALDGLPGGRGLNIAYEAVDRHAAGAHRDHLALRWLGRDGQTRDSHLYIGEEAIAAGAMQPLAPDDAVVATYREHGHALVRGGGLPLAVGLALADKMAKRPHVTVCFFGEGAMAEGEFHECLNLSALWKLPVAFYCENNLYAMATALGRSESETDLCLKASSYEIPAWPVDGMDVEACEDAAQRALAVVRAGGGPVFLEFRTYRFRPHSMFDPQLYRARHEFEEWKKRDPIQIYSARLQQSGLLNHDMRSRNWSCAN